MICVSKFALISIGITRMLCKAKISTILKTLFSYGLKSENIGYYDT